MKKAELLSPVGNMECLKAAIAGGCDAVYLGGYAFGARSFAGNFSNEEMIEAIRYAHIYGVKIYVTMNTLVYEEETDMFLNYVDFLYRNSVDAIIMQDLGMMDLVRKTYPTLEIHASTQMHIHNIEGVKAVEKLGLKRTVLARETSYETLKQIKEQTNIELEIFIHGALCICYSGQCLMSSMLGDRSGNRGTCAQVCRMPYELYDGKRQLDQGYLLSPKDLNSLDNIEKLLEIGIDSLKIEGRMKRPEYVYFVTNLYRKKIDAYYDNRKYEMTKEEINTLKKLFHREFTKGFLFEENVKEFRNKKRPNHIGIQIGTVESYQKGRVTCKLIEDIHQGDGIRILGSKEDSGCILNKIYQNGKLVNGGKKGSVISFDLTGMISVGDSVVITSDQEDLKKITEAIRKNERKVRIGGTITGKIGEPLTLFVTDFKNTVTVTGTIPISEAKTSPVSNERIKQQLEKMNDTPYQFNELNIDLPENIFIPMQECNQLRRKMVEKLTELRCYSYPYVKKTYELSPIEYNEQVGYTLEIDSDIKIPNQDWKQIYAPKEVCLLHTNSNYVWKIPRVIEQFEPYQEFTMAGELGSIFYYHPEVTDFSLNVTNSYTVAFLHNLGVKRITLSYELKDHQIVSLIEAYQKRYQKQPNLEKVISYYPEVMISKCNFYKIYPYEKELRLLDKKGNNFFIKNEKNNMRIFLEKKIEEDPQKYFEMGIHTVRISMVESIKL